MESISHGGFLTLQGTQNFFLTSRGKGVKNFCNRTGKRFGQPGAALTGGDPYKTTMMSWKYTLPAFVVPFMFTSHPNGIGLLLRGPWPNILLTNLTALIGVGVLAGGICGWLIRKTSWIERILLIAAGSILVYPSAVADVLGLSLAGGVAFWQWRTRPPKK